MGGREERNISWIQTKEGRIKIKVIRRSIDLIISSQSCSIIIDCATRRKR